MWILLSSTYVRDRMMIFFFPCISFVWFFSSYKCVCVCVCVCVWERERERESSIYFWFRVYVCVCVCVCVCVKERLQFIFGSKSMCNCVWIRNLGGGRNLRKGIYQFPCLILWKRYISKVKKKKIQLDSKIKVQFCAICQINLLILVSVFITYCNNLEFL